MKSTTKQTTHLRWVAVFLRGSRRLFALGILAAMLTALCDMITPQILRVAVDYLLLGDDTDISPLVQSLIGLAGGAEHVRLNLWIPALALLAVAVVKVLSQYGFRVWNTKASETMVKTMRTTMYTHIGRLPYGWHMKNRTGDIIQRCTSDIDTVKNFVSEQLTAIFRIVILLVFSVTFMFSMYAPLTWIALIPIPFVLAYSVLFHRLIGKSFRKCDESEGKLSAMAQENLTGTRVVRAFGRERYERDRFEAHNEQYTSLWSRLAKIMSAYWSSADILSGTQILLVVVFGAVFCVRGQMSAGEYIAFISYNSMLVWPIRQLGRMISELSKAGVAIERLAYVLDSEPERDDPDALAPPMNGDIAFEHVSFAYDGCPTLLHDITFTMKAGTTLGILGGTGSGKSTLVQLLDKLYPLAPGCGRITIGGVDIADIRTSHLRSSIGMVLQEPFLFSDTLAGNIAITSEQVSMDDVREAARIACLDDTVTKFAQGYDTFVGERGVTLSGGQKQRAAIARMLTQRTPIMIFDDSLSAVDTETDSKIRKELQKRFGDASVILISHRITTLRKADKILVLDHGRIVEEGTHEELICGGGIYQRIYETQIYSRDDAEASTEREEVASV
ncbi:MAG: ABC transporter ATP-binding protein [Clostridia bacterium]|nr:ABC transporter ATP-binding protein [Clostridia bacterium]